MYTLPPKKHWLVTGGAGFIGSHLVRELLRQEQRVSVLDNLTGGTLDNLRDVSVQIAFYRGDICNFTDTSQACQNVDYVIHLAALSSVAQSMQYPQQTARINVQGTVNVLEAARQSGVKRVVFASSAAVYGTRTDLPYKESTPADCQSPYALSKLAAEQACRLYTQVYGLDTVILRGFNVFGVGQNPNSAYAAVVAKFMQLALQNKPLIIDWDGLQSRDFIAVQDVVQANLLTALKGTPGEIYNVASGHTYTLLELADTLEKISGHALKRIKGPKRPGDVHASSADISKIKKLGFVPSVTLEEGLRAMWQTQQEL